MKTFSLFQRLLLVAIYLLGSIVFNQPFLGPLYGDLPFLPAVFSGLITALLAVQTEDWIYQRKGCWPKRPLQYWFRATLMGIWWIAFSHTMAPFFIPTQAQAIPSGGPPGGFVVVVMNYFMLMLLFAVPIGSVVGISVGQLVLTMTKSRLTSNTRRG